MKNRFSVFVLLAALLGNTVMAQSGKPASTIVSKNTIAVLDGDSKETIIKKAARVVPTANQYAALKNEFIAFIHYGPNSFTKMEWGNGKEDPKIFDLKELHTDQWCEAMKAAGIKMVIITVKHHDGFVLWQSRYTKHGIMSTNFKDGKGDILKELTASCKKYGLKVGVYLSPADLYQMESTEGLYGNESKYTTRTIPRAIPGRPFTNKTTFTVEADDYNEYFMNQLFELLTEYGPIHEVWFDGAHPKHKGDQRYTYLLWKKIIRKLAPDAVVFGKEDIRWCGNEAGATRETEFNVIPYQEDPNKLNSFSDLTNIDLGSRKELYKGKFLHYQPAETNTSIREGWFYRDETSQKVRSGDDVFDIYERAVGGNSIFLLNIPPNREGKFSDPDVASLKEAGKRITETYRRNLLAGATGPAALLDNSALTFKTLTGNNPEVVITAKAPVTINRFLIQEAITTQGERVEKHALDAWIDGAWKEVAAATNIGYKRILRFPEVKASKFRLRILESRDVPAIANISAHYYSTRPPQLQFSRTKDGLVTIEPLQQNFEWNPHGENALKNLNTGYKIFYTLDGSEPSASSTAYTAPFKMTPGKIKAVAVDKGVAGTIASYEFGILKDAWKIVEAGSTEEKHKAEFAIDSDKKTFFRSKPDAAAQFVVIDLGKETNLKAFAYTPQKSNGEGMMERGVVKISPDGQDWTTLESFEFGNLINDPVIRTHTFKAPGKARYVRIEATKIAGDSKVLSIAELDFFE
ncbi:MAG: alpha-L-fucosidase [Flavitalea sp.]